MRLEDAYLIHSYDYSALYLKPLSCASRPRYSRYEPVAPEQ